MSEWKCLPAGISRAQVAFPGKTSETGSQEHGSLEKKEGRKGGKLFDCANGAEERSAEEKVTGREGRGLRLSSH